MSKTNYDEDRRSSRRFQVSWEVSVRWTDQTGASFDEAGRLENLSSFGAFLYLTSRVDLGKRLELRVRVPFKRSSWMSYVAQVIRVEPSGPKTGVAVKFDTARPVFMER